MAAAVPGGAYDLPGIAGHPSPSCGIATVSYARTVFLADRPRQETPPPGIAGPLGQDKPGGPG